MSEELDADIAAMEYIVRRLTPVECERLMGLPDGYTCVHFTDEMLTDELVDEFIDIKLKWDIMTAKVNTPVKPKSRQAMRSWLKGISEEPPDAPRYKACGNGWACNQPRWIVMNLLNTQYPGWDDVPCGTSSHGINPQNGSTMFPCSEEVSQTLAVGHGGGGANGFSLDVNYGCPIADGVAHTIKFGTDPGWKSGVIQTNGKEVKYGLQEGEVREEGSREEGGEEVREEVREVIA